MRAEKNRAVSIPSAGGYGKLNIVELERPTSGANLQINNIGPEQCVELDVEFSGVNYADVCVRWGLYASAKRYVGWPICPGFEVCGKVASVGSEVSDFRVGQRAFGVTMFGGYSGRVLIPATQLWHLPEHLSPSQAAVFPAVSLTAYYALFKQAGPPAAGSVVLIHSAAGGVGSSLVQLCRIAGLRVVGVVGATKKVAYCREIGADIVIDKSRQALWHEAERAAELLQPGCGGLFSAVFDANGYTTLRKGYDHLQKGGRLVVYGFHSMLPRRGGRLGIRQWLQLALAWMRTPRFDPLQMVPENKAVLGFNLSFLFDNTALLEEAMHQLLRWAKEGRLCAPRVTTFALCDVGRAHAALESGQTMGKLALSHQY